MISSHTARAQGRRASYRPISDYGLIGNKLSAALVSKDGSIDWCCLPRFDSPSVFAAILDSEKGGRFTVSPASRSDPAQVYLKGTNILSTTFKTDTGTIVLTDFMPCHWDAGGEPPVQIDRLVECTGGEVEMEAYFEPKPDYGRGGPELSRTDSGITARYNGEKLNLFSSASIEPRGGGAISRWAMKHGDRAHFVLHYGDLPGTSLEDVLEQLEQTSRYWRKEAEEGTFYGLWGEAIQRAYLALHLLIYQPQHAMIAAPTTSLPEEIGGERNWDYRYAWLRDASLTLDAFSRAGHKDEALGFMEWLARVCKIRGPGGQTLFSIDLDNPPEEQVLTHLDGYRGSKPVRVGNAAYRQHQHDVFGAVLDTAYNYLKIRGEISEDKWQLLQAYVDSACLSWREPDSGIWEMRSPPAHYVHSKLMCWVAIDRGVKIARQLDRQEDMDYHRQSLAELTTDIVKNGWKPDRGAFTQHYGTGALDASVLLLPIYGFLPVGDERVKSTIARVREELGWKGLIRRYDPAKTDDGLPGREGAFLPCTAWLVRDLLRLDKLDDAVAIYERLLKCGNHLGLFSEMYNPDTGEALGNFPQAFTHLNLLIAGLELNQATLWGW